MCLLRKPTPFELSQVTELTDCDDDVVELCTVVEETDCDDILLREDNVGLDALKIW